MASQAKKDFKEIIRNRILWLLRRRIATSWFLTPFYSPARRETVVLSGDPVRYGTVDLALEQIAKQKISGAFAECGVYQGAMSKFLHDCYPDRRLFLFDTFQGFDDRDSASANDNRFRDTSLQLVRQKIGSADNIIIREGYFPETAAGLEEERFALVMIDFDKYEPTVAALQFFYPRTEPGGYIFVHDYSSPESDWACSRALDEFLADKPEFMVQVPDSWGTALFRKC